MFTLPCWELLTHCCLGQLPGTYYAPISGLQACATCPNGYQAPQFGSTACQSVPTLFPIYNPSVNPSPIPTFHPSVNNPSPIPTGNPSPIPTGNPSITTLNPSSVQPVSPFPTPVATVHSSYQPVTLYPIFTVVPPQVVNSLRSKKG